MVLSSPDSHTKITTNSPELETFPVAWYAIATSDSVKSKPLGVRRLGLDLVLWRDSDGKIVCQSRHCPHRGVDLALGKVITDNHNSCLECPYHGFQFAADGQCVLIPCEGKEAKISPAMRVKSYPVKECYGFIWLWWGNDQNIASEIPWFDDLKDNKCPWADQEMVWDLNFTRVAESALIDLHHFAFAHRKIAKWSGFGEVKFLEDLETKVVDHKIKSQGILKSENGKSLSLKFKNEILFPNLSLFDLEMGGTKLFVTITPIDENSTWISFRYYVPLSWLNLGYLIAKIAVWFELNFVQPDDYRLLKSAVPPRSSLTANRLVRADSAIAHWHKLNQR